MGNCCSNAGKLCNSYCGCGYCIRDQASFLYANLVNSNTHKDSPGLSDYGATSYTENHVIDQAIQKDGSKDGTFENLNRLSLDESTVTDSEDLCLSTQPTQDWHHRRYRRDSNEENAGCSNNSSYVSYQKGDLQPSVEGDLYSVPKGEYSRTKYEVEVTQPKRIEKGEEEEEEEEEEESINNYELEDKVVTSRRIQSTSSTKTVKEIFSDGKERRISANSVENQVEGKGHLYQSPFAEQKSQTSTRQDEAAAGDVDCEDDHVTTPGIPGINSEKIDDKIVTTREGVAPIPTTSGPSMASSYEEFRRHRTVSVGDNDDDSRASVLSESDDDDDVDSDLYDRTNKDIKMIDAALRMLEEARPLQSLQNLLVAAAE